MGREGRGGVKKVAGGWCRLGGGSKLLASMQEENRLTLEPWDHPEERKRLVAQALERWDDRLLQEGLWAYLVRHRRRPDRVVPGLVARFIRWLALKGRRWPHLEPGDIRAYLQEIRERGFPQGPRTPLSWNTVERSRGALRYLWPFLEWAGHPMPPHVEYPSRAQNYVEGRPALPEEDWERLWRRAGEFTPAYWQPLLKVLLVLLGEVGLTVKEAVALWRDDLRASHLLVRGARLREVPLSPLARQTLEEWLPLRDYLASHQPLPYPHLLLNPSPRRGRGRPLDPPMAVWLLGELASFAGYAQAPDRARQSLVLRLRWRAVRHYLRAGHPREKVAQWVGLRTLAGRGWEE